MQRDFWIQIQGSDRVIYIQRERRMIVDVGLRDQVIELDPELLVRWEPPFENEQITLEEKMQILRNIRVCLIDAGWSKRSVRVYQESRRQGRWSPPSHAMYWKRYICFCCRMERPEDTSRCYESCSVPAIPMLFWKDLVLFPSPETWERVRDEYSDAVRQYFLEGLTKIHWRRRFRIVERDIAPAHARCFKGALEECNHWEWVEDALSPNRASRRPEAYAAKPRIFCLFTKGMAKVMYTIFELIHAVTVRGEVEIPEYWLEPGSIYNTLVYPLLKRNRRAQLRVIKNN